MKTLKQFGCGVRARAVAAALAICATLFLPALVEARAGGGGSPPPPLASSDDETVGTLPVVGGSNSLHFLRFQRDGRASFYLEGSLSKIQGAIVWIAGHNAVTVEFLDGTGENVRLTFHGRVQLVLDRHAVEAAGIDAGVMVPRSFGAGQAQFGLGSSVSEPTGLGAGALPLPMGSLLTSGALSHSPFHGQMISAAGARTSLQIAASRELVSLTQTH
jgi:hypothetical protein